MNNASHMLSFFTLKQVRYDIPAVVLITTIGLLPVSAAWAQNLDYVSLEEMFEEPVTGSVTGSPQRASEVPATIEIITQEEIRRSGAKDIPGVLRHVAGMDILQWTSNSVDFSVRGYNKPFSSQLLVMINGRQVYADHFNYTLWSSLPVELDAIHQIEVVKGPNSALFGFNAVGGIINIITHDPRYEKINRISVTGGTQEHAQVSGVTTVTLGNRGGLLISAGHREDDDFSTVPITEGGWERLDTKRSSASIDGRISLNESTELGIEATYNEADQTNYVFFHSLSYEPARTRSLKSWLTVNSPLGITELSLYRNRFNVDSFPLLLPVNPVHVNSEITVANIKNILKLGTDHIFRISAEYRESDMDTTPVTGGNIFHEITSVSGMWNWQINSELTLTNAVRMDHLSLGRSGSLPETFTLTNADWDRNIDKTSYNSGLVWPASQTDTLRFTVAKGVQLPSLNNLGGLLIVEPFGFITGLPTLDPTTVKNYELSWDRDLPSINGQVSLDIFYGKTEKTTSQLGGNLFPAGIVSAPANIGDSEDHGVELSLKGELDDQWRWRASYRYEQIDDKFLSGFSVENTLINFEDTTPVHIVNANLGWTQGPWEVDGYLRYQSETQAIHTANFFLFTGYQPIPGYVSVDGRIAYKWSDTVTFELSGQGLGKARQRQHEGSMTERRVFATARVNF